MSSLPRRRPPWILSLLLLVLLGVLAALAWPQFRPLAGAGARLARACHQEINCVNDRLRQLVAVTDPRHALSVAAELSRMDTFSSEGHTFAHEIGYATYEKYPTMSERLRACGDTLGSGCYHGVLMLFISKPENAGVDMAGVCAPFQGQEPHAMYTDCVHGIGHGLMMSALMQKSGPGGWPEIRAALAGCHRVRQVDASELGFCTGGVFMEYRVAATMRAFHYPTPPAYDADDPLWPCNRVTGTEQLSCYNYQGTLIALRSPTPADAFRICGGAGGEAALRCASNIGRDRVTGTLRLDRPLIGRLCGQAADVRLRSTCFIDSARYYLYLNRDLSGALSMCALPRVPDRPGCTAAVRRDAEAEYALRRARSL